MTISAGIAKHLERRYKQSESLIIALCVCVCVSVCVFVFEILFFLLGWEPGRQIFWVESRLAIAQQCQSCENGLKSVTDRPQVPFV